MRDSVNKLKRAMILDTSGYHRFTDETADLMCALLDKIMSYNKLCLVPLDDDGYKLVTGMVYTLSFATSSKNYTGWDIVQEHPIADENNTLHIRPEQLCDRYVLFIEGKYDTRNGVRRSEHAIRMAFKDQPQEIQEKFMGGVYVGKREEAYLVEPLDRENIFLPRTPLATS